MFSRLSKALGSPRDPPLAILTSRGESSPRAGGGNTASCSTPLSTSWSGNNNNKPREPLLSIKGPGRTSDPACNIQQHTHPLMEPDIVYRLEWGSAKSLFGFFALFSESTTEARASGEGVAAITEDLDVRVDLVGTIPQLKTKDAKTIVKAMTHFVQSSKSLWKRKADSDGESQSTFQSFVLTDENGTRRYIYAASFHKQCLCVESKFPTFAVARQVLNLVLFEAGGTKRSQEDLLGLLQDLVVKVLPPIPGVRLGVSCVGPDGDPPYPIAELVWGPSRALPEDEALQSAIHLNLSPRVLVRLWQALVLENKVLILSSDRASLLPPLCEALISFLLPIPWVHTYVPILSMTTAFEELADSPFPILMGLEGQKSRQKIQELVKKEWVVFEMDTGELHVPDTLARFPSEVDEELCRTVGTAMTFRQHDRLSRMDMGELCGPEHEPFDLSSYGALQAAFNGAVISLICSRHCRLPAFYTWGKAQLGDSYHTISMASPEFCHGALCGCLTVLPAHTWGRGETVCWAELDDAMFTVYEFADDAPVLTCPLDRITGVSPTAIAPEGMCFDVEFAKKGTHRFCAINNAERTRWITALERVAREQIGAMTVTANNPPMLEHSHSRVLDVDPENLDIVRAKIFSSQNFEQLKRRLDERTTVANKQMRQVVNDALSRSPIALGTLLPTIFRQFEILKKRQFNGQGGVTEDCKLAEKDLYKPQEIPDSAEAEERSRLNLCNLSSTRDSVERILRSLDCFVNEVVLALRDAAGRDHPKPGAMHRVRFDCVVGRHSGNTTHHTCETEAGGVSPKAHRPTSQAEGGGGGGGVSPKAGPSGGTQDYSPKNASQRSARPSRPITPNRRMDDRLGGVHSPDRSSGRRAKCGWESSSPSGTKGGQHDGVRFKIAADRLLAAFRCPQGDLNSADRQKDLEIALEGVKASFEAARSTLPPYVRKVYSGLLAVLSQKADKLIDALAYHNDTGVLHRQRINSIFLRLFHNIKCSRLEEGTNDKEDGAFDLSRFVEIDHIVGMEGLRLFTTGFLSWLRREIAKEMEELGDDGKDTEQVSRYVSTYNSTKAVAIPRYALANDLKDVWVLNCRATWKDLGTVEAQIVNDLLRQLLELIRTVIGDKPRSYAISPATISTIRASTAFRMFSIDSGKLQRIQLDTAVTSDDERLAFLINLYNLMAVHTLIAKGPFDSLPGVDGHRQARYNLGGQLISLGEIERLLVDPGGAKNVRMSLALGLVSGSNLTLERMESTTLSSRADSDDVLESLRTSAPERFICFSLFKGTKASPPIRVYNPSTVVDEVQRSIKLYLQGQVTVDIKKKRVKLPELLKLDYLEFGEDAHRFLSQVSEFVDDETTRKGLMKLLSGDRMKWRQIDFVAGDNGCGITIIND